MDATLFQLIQSEVNLRMTEEGLLPGSITENLGTRLIGQKVIYYPSVASTMTLARQEARQGAAEGTVIIAGEQTGGKGRIKRVWLTPRENIAMSLIIYPGVDYLSYLIMLASLAVVHSIEAVTGLKAQIKWPNDILINGKKVCGILTESDVRGNRVAYVIIGIGINVNLRLADFPEIMATATSLSDELKRNVSCVKLIRRLLLEIEKLYLALPAGEEPIYEEWRDRLATLGRRIQVESGKNMLEGIAESVAQDGSLLLRHADDSSTKIVAGDITLREYKRKGGLTYRQPPTF